MFSKINITDYLSIEKLKHVCFEINIICHFNDSKIKCPSCDVKFFGDIYLNVKRYSYVKKCFFFFF